MNNVSERDREQPNMLSVLLGKVLKKMRGKILSGNIAKQMGVKDSTYRVYEVGKQVIPVELSITITRVPAFSTITIKQLTVYLMLAKYYDKKKDVMNGQEIINDIYNIDSGVGEILKLDNVLQVNAVISYLQKKEITLTDTTKIDRHRQKLKEAIANAPCILHSLVSSYYKDIEKDLEMLTQLSNDINSIGNKIEDLIEKINRIMNLNISFNSINAPDFVQGLRLEEVYGIVSKPDNLIDPEIIDSYKSYMVQVWNEGFKQINFLLLSDNIKEVEHIVQEYRNKFMRKLFRENVKGNEDVFLKGIKNINFTYISPKAPELKSFLKDNTEFWYYKPFDTNKNNIHTVEYGFTTYMIDKAHQYKILTIGEVAAYKNQFIQLRNEYAKSIF